MKFGAVVDEEHSLPIEQRPESEKIGIAKLLFGFTGLYERWKNEYEARRYPDGSGDPDYQRRLREIEGQIEAIDREQHGFKMGNYYKRSSGKDSSWKDWILGLVGLVIVAWLARLDMKLDDISELRAEQREMAKHQEQTDKHLESTDTRVDRIENRVYRGVQ